MDPITHAASGALLALSCKDRPYTLWAVPLAALAAASPDVDVFFSPSPVDFLLLHRGITHALAALPLMGLMLTLCMFPYWRQSSRGITTLRQHGLWSFGKTFVFAILLVLLHIWLDCVTTYGTMIFLPFSEYRVRLNGIFIIDFLLFLPMLWALWRGRTCRAAAATGLLWVFLYPAACVGLREMHQQNAEENLKTQHAQEVTVLPDALAPLYWRVIYATNTAYTPPPPSSAGADEAGKKGQFTKPAAPQTVHHQGLNWQGKARTAPVDYPAAGAQLTDNLGNVSTSAKAFFDFTLLPVQETRRETSQIEEFCFYDLRFATMLPWVQDIMNKRNNGAPSFLFLAKREDTRWTTVRMQFSGAGRDSAWHPTHPPQPPHWWQWLIGLR